MTNLIQMSEQLKAVPDEWLEGQVQNPSGMVPPYLALSELNRRKSLRSRMAQPPSTTVAEDVMRPQQSAPPGMASTDVLASRQQMPQPPLTPRPGLPSPQPGGLAAMAPPAPQGPPAPQRMAGGGLVGAPVLRMQRGGILKPGPFDRLMQLQQRQQQRPEDDYWIENDPSGSGWVVRTPGGKSRPIAAPPVPEFAPYRESKPPDIKMPDLGTMLEQVRAVTREPEGASAKLDQRLAELEAQRDRVQRPRTGDALIDIGLGLMASRSPYALQALGEAGLGASQNWRQRQSEADRAQLAITERLAQIEGAREEQRQRNLRQDVSTASELASKQYGAAMVQAQLEAQNEAGRRAYDLAVMDAKNRAAQSGYETLSGLQKAILQAELTSERVPYQYTPAGLEAHRIMAEDTASAQERHRRPAKWELGLGTDKPLANWKAKNIAEGLLRQELVGKGWGVNTKDTGLSYFSRGKNRLAEEILAGRRLDNFNLSREDRQQVAYEMLNYEGNKNDKLWGDLNRYVKKQKDEGKATHDPGTGAAAAGQGVGGTATGQPAGQQGGKFKFVEPPKGAKVNEVSSAFWPDPEDWANYRNDHPYYQFQPWS